jgi:hypothetical protein
LRNSFPTGCGCLPKCRWWEPSWRRGNGPAAWEHHCTHYHRGVHRATWSAWHARKIRLGRIVVRRVPAGVPVVLGAADTVERRSGRQITATGCDRAAVRSARKHVVKGCGLNGVARRVLVPVPWARRVGAWPVLAALCQPTGTAPTGRHETRGTGAAAASHRRWLPARLLVVVVVEGGFAAVALALAGGDRHGTRVARLRWEAALSHPPAPQRPSKRGRQPTQGKRHRSLKGWAARSDTPGEELEGDGDRGARKARWIFSRPARWYPPPAKPRWRSGLSWGATRRANCPLPPSAVPTCRPPPSGSEVGSSGAGRSR